jgi:hypothetical protein
MPGSFHGKMAAAARRWQKFAAYFMNNSGSLIDFGILE